MSGALAPSKGVPKSTLFPTTTDCDDLRALAYAIPVPPYRANNIEKVCMIRADAESSSTPTFASARRLIGRAKSQSTMKRLPPTIAVVRMAVSGSPASNGHTKTVGNISRSAAWIATKLGSALPV